MTRRGHRPCFQCLSVAFAPPWSLESSLRSSGMTGFQIYLKRREAVIFSLPQIQRSANYPTTYNQPPWLPTDDGRVALTAYFRNPKKICVCKPTGKQRMRKKPPIGDRLWIQMADFRFSKRFTVIPLNRNQLTDTPWVEGTCIQAMGWVLRQYCLNEIFFS